MGIANDNGLFAERLIAIDNVGSLAGPLLVHAVAGLHILGESQPIELFVVGDRAGHRAIRPAAANGRGAQDAADWLARFGMFYQRLSAML